LVSAKTYFTETFDSDSVPARWVQSLAKDDYGVFDITAGKFFADAQTSRGLRTSQDAKFYAISAPLDEAFDNKDKDLVIQFTAKFEQNIDCGGGYIKLLPKIDPEKFNGDTEYSIMFGPDICGYDKKVHAIISYKGKNHLIKKKITPGSDELTHLYTFVIHPDQTYEILVDNKEEAKGSITEDWDVLPPKTIKDPEAKKPADWVDKAMIDDPQDVKPSDWDDVPEYIVDPEATKPEDWDDDMDGDWEAPKIKNPDWKGEWKPKQIKNPDYVGPWVHPDVPNPEYYEDLEIYHFNNAYVGFDLWQVKSGTIFDSIIVTDSVEEAKAFAEKTFEDIKDAEKKAKDVLDEQEKKEIEARLA
ncbi:Calreticulin/calnexin, partial [Zopfochytrium polystomum]